MLSGDDNMALDLIESGGDGVISVASNLIPGEMVEMIHLALKGDMKEARALETTLSPFFSACFVKRIQSLSKQRCLCTVGVKKNFVSRCVL